MNDTFFRPADSLKTRVAPTEVAPPRGYPLQGEVHDENAYALGGVAGHAGLFSTAADLAVFAQMMLNGGEYDGTRIFADSTVALFTKRAAGTRALGWDTCGGSGSCGKYLGEDAYGHTGFTGTSLWIDPDRDMFVVLLTNRVHEARAKRPAKVIADVRADLADAAALAVTDYGDGPMAMPAKFRADKAVDWNRPDRSTRTHTRLQEEARASRARRQSKSRSARRSRRRTVELERLRKNGVDLGERRLAVASAKKPNVDVASAVQRPRRCTRRPRTGIPARCKSAPSTATSGRRRSRSRSSARTRARTRRRSRRAVR